MFLSYLSSDYDHTNIFDSYTFCTYVCHWINHHLVFFSESMSWHKKEKQQENSSEFFTLDLGKALINSILIKSSLGHSLLIPCSSSASLGHSLLIPCSSSDACMLLFNANFSTCKLIIDWKFDKKQYYPFFIVKVFFLKMSLISALMTVVNPLFFNSIHHCFVCLCF